MSHYLTERAVLMKFSGGLPGQRRKNKSLTGKVIAREGMGQNAGKWIADLYPEHALKECKTVMHAARAYHAQVTLPFGCKSEGDEESGGKPGVIAGVGILPVTLIREYRERMRTLHHQFMEAAGVFCASGQAWLDWAKAEHNGTFDPADYPGCSDKGFVDVLKFAESMCGKFYLRSEPLPVPDSEHFTESVTKLLGVDVDSVSVRVRDAGVEAQRELLRRMIEPVKAMAEKLAEQPKDGRESPIFRDSLVENVRAIAELAPKLNLSGDAQIDAWCTDLRHLCPFNPATVRDNSEIRDRVAQEAAAIAAKMSAYKL